MAFYEISRNEKRSSGTGQGLTFNVSCLFFSLAQTDALTKLLIEKGLITKDEFMQKLSAERVGAYAWSSAAAHLAGRDDQLVKVEPLLKMVGDWQAFLSDGVKTEEAEKLDLHERTGRPLESESFVGKIERRVGRILRRQKPGPKRRLYQR